MSGALYSTSQGFSGRQPDYTENIKQFTASPGYGNAEWIYTKMSSTNTTVITTYDKQKTVLIPKDLTVLGTINNPSDKTLKENIETVDSGDLINNLNPVTFQFKNDIKHKKHYGLIAQELELVYPELVTNTDTGFKTVNYIELIPILLAQMKNMQKETDGLKSEIDILKKELAHVKDQRS
jgi:hypothetical protein